ncbi:MAG: alpha/beta hydrolase [Mesorhizobium sp.]
MTDYTKLVDAETWAFIDKTNSFYPPGNVDFSMETQRDQYDTMCRAFHSGYPKGLTAETTVIKTPTHDIPIRIYKAAKTDARAVVIYYHGGGFTLGGLESHDDVCAEICDRTGYEVVSVDYRLSPEHIYPASHDDGYAAFEWAAVAYANRAILICGDSAGGNIGAAVTGRYRRHAHAPIGQVLIYPGLGGDRTHGSYITHPDAPLLSLRDAAYYIQMRTGGVDISNDPGFGPLVDTDFAGLPPTVIVTAQCDPLASDGPAYRDAILRAGGLAANIEEMGLVHGYLRARHSVRRARESFSRIVEAVRALGKGEWITF